MHFANSQQVSQKVKEEIGRDVLQKAVDGLREEGCQFVGVLFAGMMLTPDGPRVLEFNCRFGDPGETELLSVQSYDHPINTVTMSFPRFYFGS